MSQTPIYANSHYFGVIGNVSQISPEDMPLYDLLWPYLTNDRVIAIFGPYPSAVPLKAITTEECSGKYCIDMSTDLPLEAQTFKASIYSKKPDLVATVPTTTPLLKLWKKTTIENAMITTPVESISPDPQYLVLIAVNKTVIQYVFLNVSKI